MLDAADLRGLGWSSSAVGRALGSLLHRVHQGVYAWGTPTLTREGRWLAAARAYGRRARTSHRTAAALQAVRPSQRRPVEVASPAGRRGAHVLVELHLTDPHPDDVDEVDGIPCSSVARVLVELGDVLPPRSVERAMEEALAQGTFDLVAVQAAAARRFGTLGAAVALDVLGAWTGGTWTRSELEERLLAIVDARGLPRPVFNHHVDGAEVDAVFVAYGVCVEVDSFKFHARRRRFRADREKEVRLELTGQRLLRVLDEHLVHRADEMGDRIERALRQAGWTPR